MNKHPITTYRERENLSQKELGKRLGLSRWTINRIENGERMPSWKSLGDWERITGISRHELRPDIFREPAQ